MNNKDIKTAMAALQEAMFRLEDEYTENGGEVTEETEAQEAHIDALKTLLEGEGIDSLGRWLKSKEDLIKTLKAERDSVNRQIKAAENTIDYIKSEIYRLLTTLGIEKVKGTFYSFAPVISHKTEVNKEILEDKYLAEANMAMEKILPPWVTFKLSASVKAIPEWYEGDYPEEFRVIETPSCRFVKPRAGKED